MIRKMIHTGGFVLLMCGSLFACEEKAVQCIPINDGLLTEIPAIMVKQYVEGSRLDGYNNSSVDGCILATSVKQAHLVRLLKHYEDRYEDEIKEYVLHNYIIIKQKKLVGEFFSPFIIQCKNEPSIELLYKGLLSSDKSATYAELKEAIRYNRAAYYPIDRGILMYDLRKQPSIEACKLLENNVDQLISEMTKKYLAEKNLLADKMKLSEI